MITNTSATVWQCTDGTEFTEKSRAIQYEFHYGLAVALGVSMSKIPHRVAKRVGTRRNEVATFIAQFNADLP